MPAGHRRVSNIQLRVGRRVRDLRERVGITQAELARRMRTSPSHLNAVEMGYRAMTLPTLEAIAQGLGVEVAEIFPLTKETRAPSKAERLWFKLADRLRERDPDYLKCVDEMLDVLDRAFRNQ